MTIGRVSLRWLLAGACTVAGAYWIGLRVLQVAGLDSGIVPYLGPVVGGLAGGAVMTAHVVLRPRREPLVAGVLAIAMFAVVFMALPHARFTWIASRSDHPWLVLTLLAALAGATSAGGAAITNRFAQAPACGAGPVLLLGMLLSTGLLVLAGQAAQGLGAPNWLFVVVICASVFAGGYATQALVAEHAPFASGLGVAVTVVLFVIAGRDEVAHDRLGQALVGGLMMAGLGTWGAGRAWRRRVRRGDVPGASIPPARAAR
jgi:hypothetical protein